MLSDCIAVGVRFDNVVSHVPPGVLIVYLLESQSERDADSSSKTAESHEEVAAEVEHFPQTPRHREGEVVDEDAQK